MVGFYVLGLYWDWLAVDFVYWWMKIIFCSFVLCLVCGYGCGFYYWLDIDCLFLYSEVCNYDVVFLVI